MVRYPRLLQVILTASLESPQQRLAFLEVKHQQLLLLTFLEQLSRRPLRRQTFLRKQPKHNSLQVAQFSDKQLRAMPIRVRFLDRARSPCRSAVQHQAVVFLEEPLQHKVNHLSVLQAFLARADNSQPKAHQFSVVMLFLALKVRRLIFSEVLQPVQSLHKQQVHLDLETFSHSSNRVQINLFLEEMRRFQMFLGKAAQQVQYLDNSNKVSQSLEGMQHLEVQRQAFLVRQRYHRSKVLVKRTFSSNSALSKVAICLEVSLLSSNNPHNSKLLASLVVHFQAGVKSCIMWQEKNQ